MTGPPPGPPHDEPPHGWQPPGPPPGWQPPPPGWQPPPPPSSTGTVVGLAIVGVVLYCAINVVFAFSVLVAASDAGNGAGATVGVGAAVLFLLTFGGGAALIAMRTPWAKGLGIGLMIGWALVSIVSVGFCTGLNPEMYTGGMY